MDVGLVIRVISAYGVAGDRVQFHSADMTIRKRTLAETEGKASSTERADDTSLLKSMIERATANAGREPKFVFDLDQFVGWIRSHGYDVTGPELHYWKRVAKGDERPRSRRVRRDKAESRRGGKLGGRSRRGLSAMSSDEARDRLFAAFQRFSRGENPSPFNRVSDVLSALNSLWYRPYRAQKVEKDAGAAVPSAAKTRTSEGIIEETKSTAKTSLPDVPPKLWIAPRPGRPLASEGGRLMAFLEEVYAQYLPAHRDTLRGYIRKHDPKLYKAIQTFERDNDLPAHLAMTTQNERLLSRLQQAAAKGTLTGLGKSERRSVTGKVRRASKLEN